MAVLTAPAHRAWPRRWVLLVLLCLAASAASAQKVQDYQVEAVYLFNFTQFVQWPDSAFADADAPFVIGILGNDPFGSYLDDTVRDEHVGQRSLKVVRYRSVEEVGDCQVLFIGRSESARLDAVLDRLKGRGTLTVSNLEGFVGRGGMIGFVMRNDRVRLGIDLVPARMAGLTLSSKLLRVADSVAAEGGP